MKKLAKEKIGYLQIRFAIYSLKVFFAFALAFTIATAIFFLCGAYLAGTVALIAALGEWAVFIFYKLEEKRKYKNFGVNKINVHTGEIHFRLLNLKGMSKESIERDTGNSYIQIIESVTKSRGKTVFTVTHKTFIRQMFMALRLEGISEISTRALNFLMDNMIEYNDFEPIELTTDERYTVVLSYAGMKRNRLLALKWSLPRGDALKRYITPVPYFNLTISKNV